MSRMPLTTFLKQDYVLIPALMWSTGILLIVGDKSGVWKFQDNQAVSGSQIAWTLIIGGSVLYAVTRQSASARATRKAEKL